jgi:L-lactate dehydrogenase (cytochrome)
MLDTLRSVLQFRRFEFDAATRRLARAANVHDLRAIAKRRLPGGVFDYIDGAAEDERSLANNSDAFARRTFQPRVLREVGQVDPSTTLLGRPLSIPLVLAPTGFTRIADPQGELAVARAAARANVPYSLSTMATRSIEEVAAVNDGRKWFQVYMWRDRGLVKDLIDRARQSDYEALILTV